MGSDCISPSRHTRVPRRRRACSTSSSCSPARPACRSASSPRSARWRFWHELAAPDGTTRPRASTSSTIDGGEGGTGAAPLVFTDSVALPFRLGFSRGLRASSPRPGCTDDVVFVGSGKLGFPENAVVAFALGCDMINVAREAMLSIGCIQAQQCHTDNCPTGVATQNPWLRARPRPDAEVGARRRTTSARCARTCSRSPRPRGVEHPGLIGCPSMRDPHGPDRGDAAARGVRLRPRVGLPVRGRPGGDHPAHAGDRAGAITAGERASRVPPLPDDRWDDRGGGGARPSRAGPAPSAPGTIAGGPASPAMRANSRSAARVPIRRSVLGRTTVTPGDSRSAVHEVAEPDQRDQPLQTRAGAAPAARRPSRRPAR